MSEGQGHIELERALDSIIVGCRHRHDAGDLDALERSIKTLGLLQPITITPDGVLVCGWRRLQVARRLGWRTLKVWVRSGISDDLSLLLAEQDDHATHKPLNTLEAETLYREVKRLLAEDAARRQAATRFGAPVDSRGGDGAGDSPAPRGHGDTRAQAAGLVTGKESYHRFEQVSWLKAVAADEIQRQPVRDLASNALASIEAGGPVDPVYKRVKAAVELARDPAANDCEVARLGKEALARVNAAKGRKGAGKGHSRGATAPRSARSFNLTWRELDGWSQCYDIDELIDSLRDEDWIRFERVVAESVAFLARIRNVREAPASA